MRSLARTLKPGVQILEKYWTFAPSFPSAQFLVIISPYLREVAMTITGHVHGNTVTIDDSSVHLPEGAMVQITLLPGKKEKSDEKDEFCGAWVDDRSAEEIIKDIVGSRVSRKY